MSERGRYRGSVRAYAIFHRGGIDLDSIARDESNCWAQKADELAAMSGMPSSSSPSIPDMKRRGFSCKAVNVTWDD